jgi:hypothetical protein
MAERNIIQSSGFANIGDPLWRTGFTVRLRQPNYRGLMLSLIEGIDLTVDGETYPAQTNSIIIRGEAYCYAAMAESSARWNVGECLQVNALKVAGLAEGVHEVSCTLRLRHPYFPPQFQPAFVRETRQITIIQA